MDASITVRNTLDRLQCALRRSIRQQDQFDPANGQSDSDRPFPEVLVGAVDPVSQGPWAGYLYNSPSFSWETRDANRLLAVHANEDVVSEVDVSSGVVTKHTFFGSEPTTPSTGNGDGGAL